MLIKSESVTNAGLKSVSGDEQDLKGTLESEEASNKRRPCITKHFSLVNERRLHTSIASDISEVTPHLLLCGAVALQGNILEELDVTCVINATKELPDTPLPSSLKREVLYFRVDVDDKPNSDILSWLDIVTDIIQQVKLVGGKTLIHCVAGVSRSATLCIAYLIKYENYSLHDSYVFVKRLRDIIRPNSGFFGQLVKFEKRITGKQTVSMVYNDYAHSYIPQFYEEDYYKLHLLKCKRGRR